MPGGVTLGELDVVGSSTDAWYLAGVRSKVWALWVAQVRPAFKEAITVEFTIQADGSVGDLTVVSSSGSALLDLAAQRAISSAAPFAPLPKSLASDSLRIRGVFRPES